MLDCSLINSSHLYTNLVIQVCVISDIDSDDSGSGSSVPTVCGGIACKVRNVNFLYFINAYYTCIQCGSK